MDVLEISYNCFLINYKSCIWGFVSSGKFIFVMGEMVPDLLTQHIGFNLNHKFDIKKSPLNMNSAHSFKTLHSNYPGM